MKHRTVVSALILGQLLLVPTLALANDDFERTNEDGIEQVIPPATVEEKGHEKSVPIDFAEIKITNKTPADQFVSATTPLVVALMLGSVGLVVYTLARGEKYE